MDKNTLIKNFSAPIFLKIEKKVDEIFSSNIDRYEEIKNWFSDTLFNGMTLFSSEYENILLKETLKLIESIDYDDFISRVIDELRIIYPTLSSTEIEDKAKYIVNVTKSHLISHIKIFINESIPNDTEIVLDNTLDSLYAKSNTDSIKSSTVESTEKIIIKINDLLAFGLNIFTEFNMKSNEAVDRILEGIKTKLDVKKINFTNTVVNWAADKIDQFIYKVNDKIGNVFLPTRISLDESGYHVGIGFDLGELQIGNTTLGQIGYTIDSIRGAASILKANNSLNRLKNELNANNNPIVNNNVPTKSNKSNNKNSNDNNRRNEESKDNKSVEYRKKVEKIKAEEQSESDKKKESKNENYDNSIPPRAKVKQDPRREAQELVLWEGKGGGYVLLRNKCGSYIVFDENGTVRIQAKNGSYIQLGNNGNIDIEASGNVRLNCAGASYAKQF